MPTPAQIQCAASFRGITPDQRVQLLNSAQRVAFRYEPVAHAVNIERRQVTTPVMTAYEMNLNGWRILPEEMDAAMDYYMANSQVVGRMHTELTNSYPIRCMCDGYQAYLTIQVEDDQDWADICNGVYKGTSWAGLAEVVDIPEELAAAIGIAPGQWLFNIAMLEDSFVDVPAVQAATFNAANTDLWAEETGTLVDKMMRGMVKPRVRGGKLPMPPGDTSPRGNGLLDMLQRMITQTFNTLTQHSNDPNPLEDTDMGMTPEELARLDQLSQTVETLTTTLADVVKAQNAATTEETPPAEEQPEAPAPVTLEDINASIAEAVANATAPLLEKITAMEAQPAASGMLREHEVEQTAAQGEPYSAMSPDDPRRQEALSRL